MDKLEEYIRNNRDNLDKYSPSPDIWKGIKRILKKKRSFVMHWLSIAAIFTVILGTALLFFRPWNRQMVSDNGYDNHPGPSNGNIQLKETEIYYNNMANSLYREAIPLLTGNPEIKKELSVDMTHLDSICSDIKKDLKDNVANREVVEALIQNYRIRIRLLEDMLTILKENKVNPEKNKSHEL